MCNHAACQLRQASYEIGTLLYLKTDPEQRPRIVTGIILRQGGMFFELSTGTDCSNHYDFECSQERNMLLMLEN